MGLSAFNAMRARLAQENKGSEEVKTSEPAVKVTEVKAPVEDKKESEDTEEVKADEPKKKTDAEKLKKE